MRHTVCESCEIKTAYSLRNKPNNENSTRITLLSLQIVSFSLAQDLADRKKHFNLSDKGLAIEGYDPVTYFTEKKPVKGKKEMTVTHQGLTYYFSSPANKDLF